jgi:hypothetical protein
MTLLTVAMEASCQLLVMVSICDVKPGMPEQGWSNWQACAVLAVQNSSLV